MAQIHLKKIINKPEVRTVIQHWVDSLSALICIKDMAGKQLYGAISGNSGSKHPIEVSGEVIGWVIGDEKAVALAAVLACLAKQEQEKRGLANELLEKYQEIDLLYDISTQITASLDLKQVAQLVIEEAGNRIQSTSGSVWLLNQETQQFEILSRFGTAYGPEAPLLFGQGIIGTIIQTGKGEIVNDVVSDPRFVNRQGPVGSLMCVPLKTKEQVLGAIAISNDTPITYTAADLKLLTMFALQAAVAIEKALLYEQSCTAAKAAQEQAQQLKCTLYELHQAQAQLVQSEKLSGLGQMVAGIAHEINNPVNFIYGNLTHAHQYAQDLLDLLNLYNQHYPTPVPEILTAAEAIDLEFLVEDLPNLLSSMKLGVDRIRQIVLSLRNFSRLDQTEMQAVNLHEGIDSTLLILHHRLKATGSRSEIQVVKEYDNLPLIECYAGQLNQVFMNIISNAIDALEAQPGSRTITICTAIHADADTAGDALQSESVIVRIHDNGSGISEAVRTKLFEPFFTTKPVGKGTGLGLSISHQIIVEKHHGLLKCFSQPGQGTEFWIQIPVVQKNLSQSSRNMVASLQDC